MPCYEILLITAHCCSLGVPSCIRILSKIDITGGICSVLVLSSLLAMCSDRETTLKSSLFQQKEICLVLSGKRSSASGFFLGTMTSVSETEEMMNTWWEQIMKFRAKKYYFVVKFRFFSPLNNRTRHKTNIYVVIRHDIAG